MDENITPSPKPGPRKSVKPPKIYDPIIEIDDVEVEVKSEEIVDEVVEVAEVEEIAAPEPVKASSSVPPTRYAVVGADKQDRVLLSKCVRNDLQRKSLTVHHLQRRLSEWGYAGAYADRDGYYGDKTTQAVAEFQKDHKLPGDGVMNAQTMTAIFEGDTNVKVVLDA
jgi:murein L,D-transpeptidase YcbB/YkuD